MRHDNQPPAVVRLPWHVEVRHEAVPTWEHHPSDAVVTPVLPDDSSPWPISSELGLLLGRLQAEHDLHSVLEFGAGSSSLVTATAMAARGGGRLTSLEQDTSWCAEVWGRVIALGSGIDAELVPVTPRLRWWPIGLHYSYDVDDVLARRGPFDLVVIDAPQYWFGRGGAFPTVKDHLDDGALLVLDDAARKGERWALYRWLRTYPGLELVAYDESFGGKGVALLRWQVRGEAATRLSVLGVVSSLTDRVYSVLRRRLVRMGLLPKTD